MSQFKPGDIVRYNHGCTALAKLGSPHAGGWSAEQCMGGGVYVSENFKMRLADEEDMRMWNRQAWHRGEGIPPIWRPVIKKVGGWWRVTRHVGCPQRWMREHLEMMAKAHSFAADLNEELKNERLQKNRQSTHGAA